MFLARATATAAFTDTATTQLWSPVSFMDSKFGHIRIKPKFYTLEQHRMVNDDLAVDCRYRLPRQAPISYQQLKLFTIFFDS